jgi:hypothetical protein
MSFKEQFSDYKRYDETKYYYSQIPAGIISVLQGLIIRISKDETNILKETCNQIAAIIPSEPTSNWGWDWLIHDLDNYMNQLSKKFPKFMDFIIWFVRNYASGEDIADLNEAFEEHDFGYRVFIENSNVNGVSYYWTQVESPEIDDSTIQETVPIIADICEQSKNHLMQAKEQIQKAGNTRAWKDALRDCLSAMEALINQLGGSTDLNASIKNLRNSKAWGPDTIIKDGGGIWDRMHDLYPDIRHGNPEISELTREEVIYWIDRIMAYITYIARIKVKSER